MRFELGRRSISNPRRLPEIKDLRRYEAKNEQMKIAEKGW
jgi:hypothetical protein